LPIYVIEREIAGVGDISLRALAGISQSACFLVNKLGPAIQWVESFVTPDKIYCVYIASDEEILRQHARQGGLPVSRISEVKSVIDPRSSEV
jgi:hypothetical protein